MTSDQFDNLLDRHGADLALWPAEHRAEAEHVLASSAAARKSLAALREVELYWAASQPPDLGIGWTAVKAMRVRERPAFVRLATRMAWPAIAAAFLLCGIATGSIANSVDDEPSLVIAHALSSPAEVADVD